MASGRRQYPVEPTKENMRLLWDRVFGLEESLAAANTTILEQASTIDSLSTEMVDTTKKADEALLTAGNAVSATPGGGGTSTAGSDSHPNHVDEVIQAKADIIAAGVSIAGPCGAFEIVKTVAWRLRLSDPNIGILSKPSGNNCGGYATDIIVYTDGIIYDILGDGGGANDPQWNFGGTVDPTRYRIPIVPTVP